MKKDNTLYYEVTVQPGSDLEKAVDAYLKDRNDRRIKAQQEYDKRVEKQKRKHERSGL